MYEKDINYMLINDYDGVFKADHPKGKKRLFNENDRIGIYLAFAGRCGAKF